MEKLISKHLILLVAYTAFCVLIVGIFITAKERSLLWTIFYIWTFVILLFASTTLEEKKKENEFLRLLLSTLIQRNIDKEHDEFLSSLSHILARKEVNFAELRALYKANPQEKVSDQELIQVILKEDRQKLKDNQ